MIPVIVAIALIALIIYSLTDKGQMRDGGNNSNSSSGSSNSNSGSSTPPPSNTNASSKSDK